MVVKLHRFKKKFINNLCLALCCNKKKNIFSCFNDWSVSIFWTKEDKYFYCCESNSSCIDKSKQHFLQRHSIYGHSSRVRASSTSRLQLPATAVVPLEATYRVHTAFTVWPLLFQSFPDIYTYTYYNPIALLYIHLFIPSATPESLSADLSLVSRFSEFILRMPHRLVFSPLIHGLIYSCQNNSHMLFLPNHQWIRHTFLSHSVHLNRFSHPLLSHLLHYT